MIPERMFYIDKASTFQRSGQKYCVNKNWEIYFIRAVLSLKNTVKYQKKVKKKMEKFLVLLNFSIRKFFGIQ